MHLSGWLAAAQLNFHLHPRKGDGAAYPGGHQQASGGKEGYQE